MAPDKGRAVGFLDLSAELRNEIYAYLLTLPKHARIHFDTKALRASAWNSLFEPLQMPFTAITRVSRSLNAEAAPVLYGSNKFDFFYPETLNKFSKRVGHKIKHLRHVKSNYFKDTMGLELVRASLKPAIMLVSLEIRVVDIPRRVTAIQMANILGPMFRAWHGARKQDSAWADEEILDILRLTPSVQCDRTALAAYEKEVKELIAATLKWQKLTEKSR